MIAAKTPQLLILDEITNNLDLGTKDHVIQVLKEYPGAMIAVSHEKDFLQAIDVGHTYTIIDGYDDCIKWLNWPDQLPTIEDVEIDCRKHYGEFITREFIRYFIIEKDSQRYVTDTVNVCLSDGVMAACIYFVGSLGWEHVTKCTDINHVENGQIV